MDLANSLANSDRIHFAKLGTDNYGTWHVKVRFVLESKGWAGAIDDAEDAHSSEAKALIGLSVQDFHLPTVTGCANAKEAWEALEELYKTSSRAQILRLKQQLNSLVMDDSAERVTQYVSRAMGIRDQLAAAGSSVDEDDVVMAVLAGLPEDYKMIATVLENSDEELTLSEVLAKLILAEQRIGPKNIYPAETALFTKVNKARRPGGYGGNGGSNGSKVCWYCLQPGHFKADCPKRKKAVCLSAWEKAVPL